MLRPVAPRGQHVGAKRYATDALRSCRGDLSSEPKRPMVTHPCKHGSCDVLFAFAELGAYPTPCSLHVSVQRPDRFFRAVGLQIGLRRVTRYGRPGHLIPKGSRQLAGGKRSATTAEVHGPAGLNVGIKR